MCLGGRVYNVLPSPGNSCFHIDLKQPNGIMTIITTIVADSALHYVFYAIPPFLLLYLSLNYFHNSLNIFPGPFWAHLTDLWRFMDVKGRRPELTHIALHRRYGDVVRLGPRTLSFADPKAAKVIYGLNKGFTKVLNSQALKDLQLLTGRIVRVLPSANDGVQGRAIAIAILDTG